MLVWFVCLSSKPLSSFIFHLATFMLFSLIHNLSYPPESWIGIQGSQGGKEFGSLGSHCLRYCIYRLLGLFLIKSLTTKTYIHKTWFYETITIFLGYAMSVTQNQFSWIMNQKISRVQDGWRLTNITSSNYIHNNHTLTQYEICVLCGDARHSLKYFLPSVGQLFFPVTECWKMCKCKSSLVLFALQLLGQLRDNIASASVHYGYGFNKVVPALICQKQIRKTKQK